MTYRVFRVGLLATAVAAALVLAGCGGDGSSELGGSASTSYDLDYDTVHVTKLIKNGTFEAMIVEYIDELKHGSEVPVKVVANAPIEQGVEKDLVANNAGALIRVMQDSSQFDDMKSGTILFTKLGAEEGSTTAGEFYITFDNANGTTLNGKFSAPLIVLDE